MCQGRSSTWIRIVCLLPDAGDAGLRIAREEMVESVVSGALAGTVDATSWLTLTLDGKPYVVITTTADDAWGSGRLQGPSAPLTSTSS